uniref:Uncharacterized protein n=1 Tax=Ixodes ricinus TaxID=34613 RepID=A0A6B0UVN3_IXORI
MTNETRVRFSPHAIEVPEKKIKKNEQRSPSQLAARTSGHVIWSRLYAANVDHSHALGLAKHRTRAEFQTLLWLGYCRHCSHWTPATTRMHVEASIVTSPDRMRTQTSRPLCEQHLNIVTAGIAKLDDALPGIVLLPLSPQLRHQISRRRD